MVNISTNMYNDIEVYLFKLSLFLGSTEYIQLPPKKRLKIDREVLKIANVIDVLRSLGVAPKNEKTVMGWKVPVSDEESIRYFRFSSLSIAARSIGVQVAHISRCCRKERPSAGGYIFKYEDEFVETVSNEPKWYDHH